MSDAYVKNVIEAALLAAGAPLPLAELARLFDDSTRPSAQQVRAALAQLAAEYSGRGIELNPNIIRTLLERNWVRVVGHRNVPGHPELLGTTREFLDYFGLQSLDELPPLAELKALSEMSLQL